MFAGENKSGGQWINFKRLIHQLRVLISNLIWIFHEPFTRWKIETLNNNMGKLCTIALFHTPMSGHTWGFHPWSSKLSELYPVCKHSKQHHDKVPASNFHLIDTLHDFIHRLKRYNHLAKRNISGADPALFQRGTYKYRTTICYCFCDEKAIDMRSQTSSETSQRGDPPQPPLDLLLYL